MKLQIINLEHFDDRVSAGEKLSWVRADRVLLIWPDRGEVLTSKLDLRLLQRQAQGLRLTLGLVSHHPAVRRHAADLGIATFDDPDHLPEEIWRESSGAARLVPADFDPAHQRRASIYEQKEKRLEPGTLPEGARRALASLALLSIVLAAAAIAPKATVIVSPEFRTVMVDLEYPIELSQAQLTIPGLPGQKQVTVTTSGEHRIATFTGQPARGARPRVTAQDLEQVQSELEVELLARANDLIRDQLQPTERLLEMSLVITRVISRSVDAEAGAVAATVGMEIELEVTGLILDETALDSHAREELRTAAPPGWVGVPGSLVYELTEIDRDGDPYLRLSASERAYQPRETTQIGDQIFGMPSAEAEERVRELLDVRDVSLEIWPAWFPWAPFVPARIDASYPWNRG